MRMALHTGSPLVTSDGYVGLDVLRAACIVAVAHGGQVLLSDATRALVEQALPEGISLRDLGSHRLKDLQRPEHLFQVVLDDPPGIPHAFPPLLTLDRHAHNLPIQPTPLLGREREIAALGPLLRRDDARLVTLTGPGGVGKTRLGLQVAAELVDAFVDGVWFVQLSRLVDPDLVVPTIAQTLGVREVSDQPIAETLHAHVQAKQLLLVLDNFEQVVGAAQEVATLLAGCPTLTLLVTSRAPLRLRVEKVYPIAPLALAQAGKMTPEHLTQYAAVALFIQRAHDAKPDFAVTAANAPAIAEICARLDGLPLAIELAAAKVTVLPPPALLARLERQLPVLTGGAPDLEERQQTMRSTLTWSYHLLHPQQQVLFRRLAVFVNGCTLEAAEAVCVEPASEAPFTLDVLAGLGALVDQSLLQLREEDGEARFVMLHVVREYALEQLEVSGESEALRQAHLAYFLALVEPKSSQRVLGLQGADWRLRLEREHDNLRTALAWARDHGAVELGLRLAVALSFFWAALGHVREGRTWFDTLLAARPKDQNPTRAWAWALGWAGSFAGSQGDLERALILHEQALAAMRALGDAAGTAIGLQVLGSHLLARGETVRGVALLDESLAHAACLADDNMGTRLLTVLQAAFNLLFVAGEEDRAVALAREGLGLAQRSGWLYFVLMACFALAVDALLRGDLAQAGAQARKMLQLAREQDLTDATQGAVQLVGLIACRTGQGDHAARLLGAASALGESIGAEDHFLWRSTQETMVALAREAVGEEAWAAAFAAGRALTVEEAIAEALEELREETV
jgi:predicted ATPase